MWHEAAAALGEGADAAPGLLCDLMNARLENAERCVGPPPERGGGARGGGGGGTRGDAKRS